MLRFLCLQMVVAGTAFGQAAPKPLEFEVASIRLSDPGASQEGYSLMTNRGIGLAVKNGSVKTLIAFAYNVRELQLSGGPGWIATDRPRHHRQNRSIRPQAMIASGKMLRGWLLANRFGLVTHNETRDQSAYALIIANNNGARNGSKLKVAVPGQRQGISGNGRGRMQGFSASTASLAGVLSNMLGRPVADQTGLTEKYDFTLERTPDTPDANQPS